MRVRNRCARYRYSLLANRKASFQTSLVARNFRAANNTARLESKRWRKRKAKKETHFAVNRNQRSNKESTHKLRLKLTGKR